MSSTPSVPADRSALLVVDAQDSFKARPYWARRGNPDFERNVARLVDAYRAASLPVVFVMHTDEDGPFARTSPYFKLMDFLAPREGEPLFVKDTRNSFTSTDLEQYLDERGIDRVVLSGIQTEQCVETTARVAADLGYEVDFVSEATLSFPIAHTVGGVTRELSPEEIVERTEFVLRDRFARIATVGEIEAELGALTASSASAAL